MPKKVVQLQGGRNIVEGKVIDSPYGPALAVIDVKEKYCECPECGRDDCIDVGHDQYSCPKCGDFWGSY